MLVCGYGLHRLARGFSRQLRITKFTSFGCCITFRNCERRTAHRLSYGFASQYYQFRLVWLPSCVTPSFDHYHRRSHCSVSPHLGSWDCGTGFGWLVPFIRDADIGMGISTCCPSDTPVGLAWSRLTRGGTRSSPWNPWSYGGQGSHPSFATHVPAFSLPHPPPLYLRHTSAERSPTQHYCGYPQLQ